jgi:hypothetical protein
MQACATAYAAAVFVLILFDLAYWRRDFWPTSPKAMMKFLKYKKHLWVIKGAVSTEGCTTWRIKRKNNYVWWTGNDCRGWDYDLFQGTHLQDHKKISRNHRLQPMRPTKFELLWSDIVSNQCRFNRILSKASFESIGICTALEHFNCILSEIVSIRLNIAKS